MLDIKMIRENPEIVKNDLKKRRDEEKIKWVDNLLDYDRKRRELIKKVDELKHKRNTITKEIAKLKEEGKDIEKKKEEMKKIPEQIKTIDEEIKKLDEKIRFILMRLPNILHESVPIGRDEHDNVVVKVCGKKPEFDFKPKNHLDILVNLGLIETEKSAEVAGRGFFYLKNELAILDYALLRYALDFMRKKGFIVIEPPFMLRRKPYEGVTDLGDFEEVMYKIEGSDLYLIATSEHPMAAMFMDEIIDKDRLPIKLTGVSPCFRREVGAHGKYTKGLYRMHQFNKVEQFVFCLPEDSWNFHEEIQRNAEEIYNTLGLHYRVVNVCTGDIGTIAAKKYDIEMWMADDTFRELGSNSNCTDYQARRLNIKYRNKPGQKPAGFVHTLNNTALATSRTMIAIIEQFQQADGTVKIPKVLWPYTGFKVLEQNS
ncbi:MAG: serine--tRNA ligase [Candidatus Aenigmatarchaeota archaeon]|nr:MAG: serine--tRNA ligase [Candidatus Aenigmarchaeota archaeon ex4484_14]RLI97624.1 MAG: serine--tRNA ligase [Candidatus Aenigmarchaeota archaeon]